MTLSPDAPTTWPSTITQAPRYGGFTEQRQRNVVSFNPDVGSPKQRRRSTAVCIGCTAVFEFNDAELADFEIFYLYVLKDGTLPFTWNHPRTLISYTWSFAPDEAPTIEATQYNFNTVTCKMIRLPQ